ncbi:MAG TPA: type II/IV secretion system protein [Gemmatimonadales bacterium]|jgi:type II secretory ATPase GspE/PulE/Tfp pilus assembly ATPase PilB-like protein
MAIDSQRNSRALRTSVTEPSAGTVQDVRLESPKTPADAWLAPVLVNSGVLTPDQAKELLAPGAPPLWTAAVAHGWATDERIAGAVSRMYRLPLADVTTSDSRISALVPESLARKHRVLPLSATDRAIQIATADPRDLDLEQTLRFVTGREVAFQVAPPAVIASRLEELYRPERAIERLLGGLEPAAIEAVDIVEPPGESDGLLEAPVAKLVDAMISDAVREGASDIHAEPSDGAVVVRYRADGVMREVMRLPEVAGAALVRRVKIWAKLDVTDPLHPHDGRATARVDGQTVDLRVSTIPVARRGEKVVVRILDKTNLRSRLADIGLATQELNLLNRLLGHREGMVLVTGPTGSGKTTTLYAALNELKTGTVNIVTVEDPVEYDVAGISQIQVSDAQGLTFAKALRSVLRQDPDIVLVGEIRDLETAVTAIQAGFSGHFVLSTLHTNDAPSAVVRLRDMGVDAFKVASVLKGVVAQRLVRRLCVECAEPVPATSLPLEARPPVERKTARVLRAVGCRSCSGRGYRGRAAIVEVMPVDETVARLIDGGAMPEALLAAARKVGMRTLWESGLERVWDGVTSLEELIRVLGERVEEDGKPQALLPVPGAATAMVAPSIPVAPAAGTATFPRILVADDDPQMRRLIRTVLQREGFEVAEADDGLDTLEAIDRGGIDLLILDIEMPRLDGLGVMEELRAQMRTATLPVIMLTAQHGESEEKALDLGAQDYLTKPVQTRSLVARVRAVLKRVTS